MRLRNWLQRVVHVLRDRKLTRLTAIAAASVAATSLEAQVAPTRPAGASQRDTVHRYGEKFVLTPNDTVVIRADTVWLPRSGAKTFPLAAPSTRAPSRDTTNRHVAPPAVNHRSHSSHSSHTS